MKSGFVALIGRPNVGKSTLLNRLVGTKVSIVSDKPQTTRNRILGVRTDPESQIIFLDTPGIHRPGYRLNERMMDDVYEVISEVDVVVHLVDASEKFGKGESFVLDMMKAAEKPTILLLNKIDLINKGKVLPLIEFYNETEAYDEIIPVSALNGSNTDRLLDVILTYLPDGDMLYPDDYLTDRHERFMVAELIREKVLAKARQELPYSTAVQVEEFDESQREDGFVRITASIIVDRPGQKKIVVGKGGQFIKEIGIAARKEIEELLDVRKIYLALNVKVVEGWRDREYLLDDLGFNRN
ncbi:MAG: GTPase Era [Acidobacteriota bacterium]|nr:MAG: GTPase Era [Acidobacteriota bacterium]